MATLVMDGIPRALRWTAGSLAPGDAGSLSYEFLPRPACQEGEHILFYPLVRAGWFFLGAAMKLETLHGASEAISRGRLTPLDLVDACLAAVDRLEPQVAAWVFVDGKQARADAE